MITFRDCAPQLRAIGYNPVPIKPGGKAPMLPDWQTPREPEFYMDRCASWGTGVLTLTVPAIDLDIRHRDVVREAVALADGLLGVAPIRIGQPPKALLAYRTSEPFDKIAGRWFALPGEDFTAEGYAAHRVEVLAHGQQFVSHATHPGTGLPYRWCRGNLLAKARCELPELSAERATIFVAAVDDMLIGAGATPLKLSKGRFVEDVPEPARETCTSSASTSSTRTSGAAWDDGWRDLDPEKVAARLDPQGWRATRNGAACACPVHNGVGHTSLGLARGEGGRLIVHCFAGCSFTDVADAIGRELGRAA